ncbi:hypothetical protein DKG77_00325 [Flagellimonas aquimarina]|uniref:DUF4236 domain-containing protein n=1 Tax=Flagellimonas aquimarina TaxID=2201895 RepID=A0A316KYM6_9FLAO|nr:hypothetical protein [Allomuricauda koreensis]PWL39322.1 hypothetical protein DKG77_00325 [Allomuricauda koreensis]
MNKILSRIVFKRRISIAPNSTIFKSQKPKTITYYYGYKKLGSRRVGLSFNVGKDFKKGKIKGGQRMKK